MFGPGFGHNVEWKLQSLKDTSLFNVVFFAFNFDESFRSKYPNVEYIPSEFYFNVKHPWRSTKSICRLYRQIKGAGKFDVIYSLGVGGLLAYLFFLFTNRESKKVIELWSIYLLNSAKQKHSLLDKINRSVIERSDFICQTWWGIREIFINMFPEYENKFLMFQICLPEFYFSGAKHCPESKFVKDFLSGIPDEQIMCFWPRSFVPSNNHPLLLEALGQIKSCTPDLLSNFKLYLWGGNVQNDNSRKDIEDCIVNNSLQQNVEIVDHPFVPQNDLFAIEERSNFFVQIANDDILSTFIIEIMCSGKPFILSNLRTFQFLNEVYGLNIDLVDNKVELITERLKDILTKLHSEPTKLDFWRREKCKEYFSEAYAKPFTHILYEKV